jgi:hypothetical protein
MRVLFAKNNNNSERNSVPNLTRQPSGLHAKIVARPSRTAVQRYFAHAFCSNKSQRYASTPTRGADAFGTELA